MRKAVLAIGLTLLLGAATPTPDSAQGGRTLTGYNCRDVGTECQQTAARNFKVKSLKQDEAIELIDSFEKEVLQ